MHAMSFDAAMHCNVWPAQTSLRPTLAPYSETYVPFYLGPRHCQHICSQTVQSPPPPRGGLVGGDTCHGGHITEVHEIYIFGM